ncbi:hypothetical protein D1872_340660 [compost metagenome]
MGGEPGEGARFGFGIADDMAVDEVLEGRDQVVPDGLVVLDEERDEGHAAVLMCEPIA